jgi:hypothetical protein
MTARPQSELSENDLLGPHFSAKPFPSLRPTPQNLTSVRHSSRLAPKFLILEVIGLGRRNQSLSRHPVPPTSSHLALRRHRLSTSFQVVEIVSPFCIMGRLITTGQIPVAGFIGRAHRIPPCDVVNDPHPTKAQTQAGGVGAPWNLYHA